MHIERRARSNSRLISHSVRIEPKLVRGEPKSPESASRAHGTVRGTTRTPGSHYARAHRRHCNDQPQTRTPESRSLSSDRVQSQRAWAPMHERPGGDDGAVEAASTIRPRRMRPPPSARSLASSRRLASRDLVGDEGVLRPRGRRRLPWPRSRSRGRRDHAGRSAEQPRAQGDQVLAGYARAWPSASALSPARPVERSSAVSPPRLTRLGSCAIRSSARGTPASCATRVLRLRPRTL